MSETKRWLHLQMQGELAARRSSLLAQRSELSRAQTRILEIDETVEAIDAELADREAKLAAIPPGEENVDAKPTT